jgi:hypothetical protein
VLRFKAIVLLLLFSLSSLGKSVEIHYCEGTITDLALFGGAQCICVEDEVDSKTECHEKETESSKCHDEKSDNHSDLSDESTCCETIALPILENVKYENVDRVEFPILLALIHLNPYYFLSETQPVKVTDFYLTPQLSQEFQVLFQTFLI